MPIAVKTHARRRVVVCRGEGVGAGPTYHSRVSMMITLNTEDLLPRALAVIDEAVHICRYARMAPLFSGGHDSYCACFVASQHRKFDGRVYHIDTGIGSRLTRMFVEQVCKDEGWKLNVLKSVQTLGETVPPTYEGFVRKYGFPGPGRHGAIYRMLKDRSVRAITRHAGRHHATILVTGCRSMESMRRMGHVERVKVGVVNKQGRVEEPYRIWTAPCHDWLSEDQVDFMNLYGLSRNPVKLSPLGMSGECFCGAFARPGELDMIRAVVPDVAAEIDRLQVVARECGHPPEKCSYGGPRLKKGEEVLETGPLCTTCDVKARLAGLNVVPLRRPLK